MPLDHESQFTHHVPPPCREEVLIHYEDDNILVVDKPAGLLSVPGRFVKDSVLHRIMYDYPDAIIVHRLDLVTSGLMVLALSKSVASDLNRQFRDRLVEKKYLADVWGKVIALRSQIDLPIRPDPYDRPRQVVDHDAGKNAITLYEVLERQPQRTRLLLMPITGRSHQLRIHLASIGHPILGCDLYAHEAAFKASDRLMLHANCIAFSHPISKEHFSFKSAVSLKSWLEKPVEQG